MSLDLAGAVCGRLGEKDDAFLLSEVDLGDDDRMLEGAVESKSLPKEPHELSDTSPELEPIERGNFAIVGRREASEADEAGIGVVSVVLERGIELFEDVVEPALKGLLLPPAPAGRLTLSPNSLDMVDDEGALLANESSGGIDTGRGAKVTECLAVVLVEPA